MWGAFNTNQWQFGDNFAVSKGFAVAHVGVYSCCIEKGLIILLSPKNVKLPMLEYIAAALRRGWGTLCVCEWGGGALNTNQWQFGNNFAVSKGFVVAHVGVYSCCIEEGCQGNIVCVGCVCVGGGGGGRGALNTNQWQVGDNFAVSKGFVAAHVGVYSCCIEEGCQGNIVCVGCVCVCVWGGGGGGGGGGRGLLIQTSGRLGIILLSPKDL